MKKLFFTILIIGLGFIFVKPLLNPPKANLPLNSSTEEDNIIEDNSNNISKEEQSEDVISEIEQPTDWVMEIPDELEQGALVAKYEKLDNNETPDPLNGSPIEEIKTDTLSVIQTENDSEYQYITGYFEVPKSGKYNFLATTQIAKDKNWLKFSEAIAIKIDNTVLPQTFGGQVELDPGKHRIEIIYNPSPYAERIDEEQIKFLIGEPGEKGEELTEVWRTAT